MSLYVASHYKNTPNDLQLMSDAPSHHLFCLLGPVDPKTKSLPEILAVVQICLEGEISKSHVTDSLARGRKPYGDLIPWTVAQHFQDQDFPSLCGARVVRIATHPDYQGMGYGSRALYLLEQYYEGKVPSLDEDMQPKEQIESVPEEEVGLLQERIEPRKSLPPLLLKLSERVPERLDYLGVSYGVTAPLLRFWKRSGFVPVYVRQTTNELTGEHSCIMLKILNDEDNSKTWLKEFWSDFRRRFISLLGFQFRNFSPALGLSVLQNKAVKEASVTLTREELDIHLTKYDIKRLEMYANNLFDYHLIMDLIPVIARLFFWNKLGSLSLSPVQCAVMLGLGLQHKTVDDLAGELELATSQLKGLFNRTIRRMVQCFNDIMVKSIESSLSQQKSISMNPVEKSVEDELEEAAKELKEKQKKELEKLKTEELSHYAIKGSEHEWEKALSGGAKGLISVKSGEKRLPPLNDIVEQKEPSYGKKKKKKQHK